MPAKRVWAGVGVRVAFAGIAAAALTLLVEAAIPFVPVTAGLTPEKSGVSVIPKTVSTYFDARAPLPSRLFDPHPNVRVASLETGITSFAPAEEDASAKASGFDERFSLAERHDSFQQRFTGTAGSSKRVAVVTVGPEETASLAGDASPEAAHDADGRPGAIPIPRPSPSRRADRTPDAPQDASPDADGRTAIYDISARVVYLPDGRRLEAHSGLGIRRDNPRFVNVKHEGPTPPNVYRLTLREKLFHGVRAIRLNPVGDGNMYGRDGMLAHPYMLGPDGASNGCVSFSDYPAFLKAYLKGDIDRLVVVEHLPNPPNAKDPGSFLQAVRKFFKLAELPVRS